MTSPIQCVAFNNSENWLGAGSKSGVVKVFDLEANRNVRSISGHKAAICSMDFHRYGDILASGSMDTNLKVWDVRRKGCIFTYKGHTEAIRDIQFSPDGKWVVTASSDCTLKVWDLSAGKMLIDFKTHSKGVTSVQFHPRELLMASGSMDRTVQFYDLERFQVVSEIPPESNGVRKILFHPEGTALFSGTEESLKVHGWEPARTFDMLPLHWGKVDDMTLSGEQLIAASYTQTNVSVWCIDIKHLRPFSGDTTTIPSEPTPKDIPLPTSGRGLFEFEQKEISPPSTSEGERGMAVNGSGESAKSAAVSESVNDEEGSPPTHVKDEERKELFAARQKLIHTPPKKLQSLFRPPSDDPEARQPLVPQPSKLDRVQYIPSFAQEEARGQQISAPNSAAEERHQNGPAVPGGRRKLHQADEPIRPAQSDSAVGSKVTEELARPAVGGFVPPDVLSADPYGVHRISSRGVEEIITNHVDISQILKSRLSSLREVRKAWSISDPKVSLEVAVNSNNTSVLVDILNLLHLKRTLWSLDMALLVLPELKPLLRSKYSMYVTCGCNIVKLILKNFAPVIKSNLTAPPQGARDIQRDQRYEKCQTCYAHLTALREEGVRIVREAPTSPAGKVIRERALMTAFAAL